MNGHTILLAIVPYLPLIHRKKRGSNPDATVRVTLQQLLAEFCEGAAAVKISGAAVYPQGDKVRPEADHH